MLGFKLVGVGVNLITITITASLLFSLFNGGIDVAVGDDISIMMDGNHMIVSVPYTVRNRGVYDIQNMEIHVMVFVEGHMVSDVERVIDRVGAGSEYSDVLVIDVPLEEALRYVEDALFSGFNISYRLEAYGEYAYGIVSATLVGMRGDRLGPLMTPPQIGVRVIGVDPLNSTVLLDITITARSAYLSEMEVQILAGGEVVAASMISLDGSENHIAVTLPMDVNDITVSMYTPGGIYACDMEVVA
jgi:hypothetical protein